MAIATAAAAIAEPLPPPPSTEEFIFTPPNDPAPQTLPPPPPTPPTPPPNDNVSSPPSAASSLYRVEVDGSTPQLLSLVRRIEPNAFVRQGGCAIQVGLFSEPDNVLQVVRDLQARGIQAQVVLLNEAALSSVLSTPGSSSSWDRPQGDYRFASGGGGSQPQGQGYFVIIPSSQEELPKLAQAVIQSGIAAESVQQRVSANGPHVAVGPFSDRVQARHWTGHLRLMGWDARIYYRK